MAERRMFAKTIIDSDAFLDMPLSTQALYFHLSMRADDEGFINKPKMIMRMIGANQNELEILLAKRYLLSFDSGVVVVKHWKIHNYIQKDRFKPTLYKEERETISIKGNNSYTEKELDELYPECIQNVDTGKVRLDKSKKDIKHKHGEYNHVLLTDKEYEKLKADYGNTSLLSMIKNLDEYIEMKGAKYKNHNLTMRKWAGNEKKTQSAESKAAAATTDVFWRICPDCGYQVKSIKASEQCPSCGEYGTSFLQGRGAEYPKEIL